MSYTKHLRDDQWDLIEGFLPGKAGDPGRSGEDNRRFVEAVIWIGKNGAKWRALPAVYGRWYSIHKRFKRWADKGYDAAYIVKAAQDMGAKAVIPSRSNSDAPRPYDEILYKERNLIERMFGKLKQFRRIATRYDKTAASFMAFLHLAAILSWIQ
jgi:transposase